MSPRAATLSDFMNGLDAATYFFVNSGLVVAATALVFFALGLWLGGLLWGRFKRKFRESEKLIESFRGEAALLKRRIAEQSTRPTPGGGPGALHSIAVKATAANKTAPPAVKDSKPLDVPFLPKLPMPSSRPFTLWTEPGWSPPKVRTKKPPPARSFTIWTEAHARGAKADAHATAADAARSRAFCVWTEAKWHAPAIKAAPAPTGRGFALWTGPNFEPSCRGPQPASEAFSLWTSPGWTAPRQPGPPNRSARPFSVWTEEGWEPPLRLPRSCAFSLWTDPAWTAPRQLGPPTRSARSFSVWTEEGWEPPLRLPWSCAFSLWTDPSWTPQPVTGKPWPTSEAWSLWTSPEFEPACRGAVPTSRAFSMWTEEDWIPAPIASQPPFTARPFSIWTETVQHPPALQKAVASIATPARPDERKGDGLFARAIAAARNVFGFGRAVAVPHELPVNPGSGTPGAIAPTNGAKPSEAAETPIAMPPADASPVSAPVIAPAESSREPAPAPARTAEPAKVPVNPSPVPPAVAASLAATAAAVEALRKTGRVLVMSAPVVPSLFEPLPPSRAFTVWGDGPAFEPPKKITQRIALAALIDCKITGNLPLPPQAPVALPPVVPPVPFVSASTEAVPSLRVPFPAPLDVEPLNLPAQRNET